MEPLRRYRARQARFGSVTETSGLRFLASRGRCNGVLRTPTGDVPPTGRAVSVDYIHVLRFRDGLHVSFNLIFDRLLMLEQLGLIPAPAATAG
jgi:SnoaL-like polyketide cyclase